MRGACRAEIDETTRLSCRDRPEPVLMTALVRVLLGDVSITAFSCLSISVARRRRSRRPRPRAALRLPRS
jgi:hypothetical protein